MIFIVCTAVVVAVSSFQDIKRSSSVGRRSERTASISHCPFVEIPLSRNHRRCLGREIITIIWWWIYYNKTILPRFLIQPKRTRRHWQTDRQTVFSFWRNREIDREIDKSTTQHTIEFPDEAPCSCYRSTLWTVTPPQFPPPRTSHHNNFLNIIRIVKRAI